MSGAVERILDDIKGLSPAERHQLLSRLAEQEKNVEASQTAMALTFESDELEGSADYVIVFDGGSKGNPGPGYGSYALMETPNGPGGVVRLDFGRTMTNNEAEYESLIAALHGVTERIESSDRSPKDFTIELRGDSALVINQITGEWKTKDDRMRRLRNQGRDLLRRFENYRLTLHGREESVRVLGH